MALRPITCGVAAGVDGGAVGAIGLGAVAGVMRGDAAAPAPASPPTPSEPASSCRDSSETFRTALVRSAPGVHPPPEASV